MDRWALARNDPLLFERTRQFYPDSGSDGKRFVYSDKHRWALLLHNIDRFYQSQGSVEYAEQAHQHAYVLGQMPLLDLADRWLDFYDQPQRPHHEVMVHINAIHSAVKPLHEMSVGLEELARLYREQANRRALDSKYHLLEQWTEQAADQFHLRNIQHPTHWIEEDPVDPAWLATLPFAPRPDQPIREEATGMIDSRYRSDPRNIDEQRARQMIDEWVARARRYHHGQMFQALHEMTWEDDPLERAALRKFLMHNHARRSGSSLGQWIDRGDDLIYEVENDVVQKIGEFDDYLGNKVNWFEQRIARLMGWYTPSAEELRDFMHRNDVDRWLREKDDNVPMLALDSVTDQERDIGRWIGGLGYNPKSTPRIIEISRSDLRRQWDRMRAGIYESLRKKRYADEMVMARDIPQNLDPALYLFLIKFYKK